MRVIDNAWSIDVKAGSDEDCRLADAFKHDAMIQIEGADYQITSVYEWCSPNDSKRTYRMRKVDA